MEQPDNNLIAQFVRGDNEAFTAVYNAYYSTLLAFVRKMIPEKEDAEDIAADIFVRLWHHRTNFDTIKNLEAFLYITARNACLDFLRHLKRQTEKQKELILALQQQPTENALPEDIKAEVLAAILEEIEKLPRSARRVFRLAYFDGLSNDEIARLLDITNQSVRNHKQRALKTLRDALSNRDIAIGALLFLPVLPHC
jgi:RNA polymerase sigma-70 factor (ECF subfamily)